MPQVDFLYHSKAMWQTVLDKVNRSVVFLDSTFAENLHWFGGASILITYGAEDIKEFSSFEVLKLWVYASFKWF